MKVADIMQKHVDFVDSDTTVIDVARLIFGRNINGVPVCKNKKVVGFLTDRDILGKFFPSMHDYVEDPFREGNFEQMEDKVKEILYFPVSKIMSKTPITIEPDAPILKAQSLMTVNQVGRLPVVDKKGILIGIISKGDIFKAVIGKKIPYLESEEYHDWIAKHFDLAIGWESRIPAEIPAITGLFKKNGVKKFLDIGCGTGEHAITLAKNGFEVLGLENSPYMFKVAQDKWKNLPKNIQAKVKFIRGNYMENLGKIREEYQAAIFMGNAMAHIPYTYKEVLEKLSSILSKNNSLIVSQLINFEKAIKSKMRLHKFTIQKSRYSPEWEHAYYWFFDPPRREGDLLTLNAGILDFNGNIWISRGMNSVKTVPFTTKMLRDIFKKLGFQTSVYGSVEGEPIFNGKFKPLRSNWLTVVAKRNG